MITQTHLLVTEKSGLEYVLRYEPTEMDEAFSTVEREALAQGKPVIRAGRFPVRFVDMIAACRLIERAS